MLTGVHFSMNQELSFHLLFQEDNTQRCSISADSRVGNSGTEDSTDDDTDMKDNGYHDAENEADQETDDDADRVNSGKLSESSGYAGSDLYEVLSVSFLFHTFSAPPFLSIIKLERGEKHV